MKDLELGYMAGTASPCHTIVKPNPERINSLLRGQGYGKEHLYLIFCNLNFIFPLFIYHKVASADLKLARTHKSKLFSVE